MTMQFSVRQSAAILCLLLTAASADAQVVDVGAAGAARDGVTDDTAHFEKALAAIGDESGTLDINGGRFLVGSLSIPPNVTLAFRTGGQLVVAQGATLEINGGVDGPPVQIFAGEGTVTGNVDVEQVVPQWFGAKGDGEHDDAQAIQRAADFAADATGRTLLIPEGEYLFHRSITFRCHLECRGLFIKSMTIDESRTTFCNDLFLPTHYPHSDAQLRFAPDHPAVALDPGAFFGIEEGELKVPTHRNVPLADGSGTIDLAEGGTLRFYSSDFFSSRRVRKGAHYYDRNDIVQIVSEHGDVSPEFAFSYVTPPDAPEWNPESEYVKGDYCSYKGEIFKATWASGPGSGFTHRHLGSVDIGPVPPDPRSATTHHAYAYEDGTRDRIAVWRRVRMSVWYRPNDAPLTVNGLRIEVRLEGHEGKVKRINAGAISVTRSNMVLNNLEISVRDREATMSSLLRSSRCVNNVFNKGKFSGATSAHLGYNIANSNVAHFQYNDCTSTNSRKGLDGRHGKNITVDGGFYNVIDNHYGRNNTIRNVTLTGESVRVPGDSTPKADLQNWHFAPRSAMAFNGANFHVEAVTVLGGRRGILAARSDVGDLYGTIVLRDVVVRENKGDVVMFRHTVSPDFDFASDVGVPDKLLIENVRLENPGRLGMILGRGFQDRGGYGPVHVRNTGPIGNVFTASRDTSFTGCKLEGSEFTATPDARVNLRDCVLAGKITGLDKANVGVAEGNTAKPGAEVLFPLEYRKAKVQPEP